MKINNKRIKCFSLYRDRYDFLLRNYNSGKILDIGNIGGVYGEGPSNSSHLKFKNYLKTNDSSSQLYGIDLYLPHSKDAALFDRQTQGDITTGLPYSTNLFDTVYLGEVLEHIINPGYLLKEIHRVLKVGGVFLLDVPNPYAIERLLRWVLFKQEDLGDITHVIFYTPASLHALLKMSGFNFLSMTTDYKQRIPLVSKWKIGLGSHLLFKSMKK